MSGDKILWTMNTDQISDKETSKLIVTVNLPLWPGNVNVLWVHLTYIECFHIFYHFAIQYEYQYNNFIIEHVAVRLVRYGMV